jgi:hypothetical protein
MEYDVYREPLWEILKILKMGVIFQLQHPLLRAPVETKGYKSVIYLSDERIIRAYPVFFKIRCISGFCWANNVRIRYLGWGWIWCVGNRLNLDGVARSSPCGCMNRVFSRVKIPARPDWCGFTVM